MQTTNRTTAGSATLPAADERRTRHRLRDLCDEVIASYRAATGHQVFTDADRAEARTLLGRLGNVPMPRQA